MMPRDSSTTGRTVHFDGRASSPAHSSSAILDDDAEHTGVLGDGGRGRRRRSSLTAKIGSLAQVGGVNSIENFARSWTRAAAFPEAAPQKHALILPGGGGDDEEQRRHDVVEYGRKDTTYEPSRASLLRAHFEAADLDDSADAGADASSRTRTRTRNPSTEPLLPSSMTRGHRPSHSGFSSRRGSTVRLLATNDASVHERIRRGSSLAPHSHIPLPGSYGTSYGTVHQPAHRSSMSEANEIWKGEPKHLAGEHQPLLVKEVEQEDGHTILVVEGQSTLPQTVFNSTNCLIGVGILSLPLGIQYAGWFCGMGFLLLSALVCGYCAKLLGKCMDVDPSLVTFADLAFISYGNKARILTGILFTLELLAANVALVVLFADTAALLIPTFTNFQYKLFSALLLAPLNFAPLRVLSFTSVLGILCCILIIVTIIFDGLTKPTAPGSIWDPQPIHVLPTNWLALPLSFGLLMSPWGGASVFPNIYRDMRHPYKFGKAIDITFTFTYICDAVVAAVGILMFGSEVRTEVTASILATEGYFGWTTVLLSVFIVVIPLTKVPLNSRPIVSTLEVICGLDAHSAAGSERPAILLHLYKFLIRIAVIIVFVVVAIVFPAFDSVVAFMGSGLCFAICIILPIMFYLKLFANEISRREKLLDYVIVAVSLVMAVTGTIWAFLPKEMIGLPPSEV